jgi:hypothetical protein
MMLREFNYTNRQRIRREDAELELIQSSDGSMLLKANLKLGEYHFEKIEPSPKIFVEAYRGATASWKRFDFGDARDIQTPDDLSLDEFKVPQGILFRVRVTSTAPKTQGKLLGEADAIRPKYAPDSEGFVQPLIQHMAADDMGDELWRIHYSDELPILKINDRIQIGVDQFLMNPACRATYAPAVIRQVLQRIALIDRFVGDEDDPADWRQRWMRFALVLSGRAAPEFSDADAVEAIEDWISDVVEAFCRSNRILQMFNSEALS